VHVLELLVCQLSFYYRKTDYTFFMYFIMLKFFTFRDLLKGSNKRFLVNVEPPIGDNSMYILIRDWIAQSSERSN
jgi:hypothetical protein